MEKLNDQYPDSGEFSGMRLEQKIMSRASKLRLPDGISSSEALSLLKVRIAESESEKSKSGSNSKIISRQVYIVSSIAAGLLMLFGIWQLWLKNPAINVIAQKGSRVEYRLPDGSDVNINSDSRITWDKRDFKNDRHLSLDGEAFFSIAKGTPFTISASRGNIRVLGTSFNVYSRPDAFKVSCLTGKVIVTTGTQSVTILPGESAEIKENDLVSYADSRINSATGWVNGEFNFDDSPLSRVLEEIERQFNVKFTGLDSNSRYFTGSFTNKDLNAALDIVCIPLGLNYEIGNKGEIFISEAHQ
jgi:ferric-dicitrate binding protein FerR (iron transport regulator)